MDSLFQLEEPARSTFLRLLAQSFGFTYICLWSHSFVPCPVPSNHLLPFDGLYVEDDQPSSSSSPSLASTLFAAYRQLVASLDSESVVWGCDNARVPGYAFRNNRPYIELKEPQLLAFSFHQTQRDFYLEAKIKTAVFMGCRRGEIELGLCNVTPQMNIEMGLKEFFREYFSRAQQSPFQDPPQPSSSNSSSLRSLSTESPDSSLIFALASASHAQPEATALQPISAAAPATAEPHQQEMQALSGLRSAQQVPTLELEESVMKSAFLAVITSPSAANSSSSTPPQFLFHLFQQAPQNLPHEAAATSLHRRASAFKGFASALGPTESTQARLIRRQSMMKRSIVYCRRLNVARRENRLRTGGARSTSTQLHHMMSERKRREKQTELFQTLRSLLPPGTKKEKSVVLTTARDQLSLLQQQIAELRGKNELLEAQLSFSSKQVTDEKIEPNSSSSRDHRRDVQITQVSESTSDGTRTVELRIRVRGECPMDGLMIRLLELLRRDPSASLMSMEARTLILESVPSTHITMRLKIQGYEWDETSFQEAVRRLVADVAP